MILEEAIHNLDLENNYQGWQGFLHEGKLSFNPDILHNKLRQAVINSTQPWSKTKLLYPRKRCKFMVDSEDEPHREEEALERFITASNPDNYHNQFPVRGGKESCDIVVLNEDSHYEFVELKSWTSKDTPIYAVVESLKNLILYRYIEEKQMKHHQKFKRFNEVDIIVLAPRDYYGRYELIDKGTPERNKDVLRKVLNDLSCEFKTHISLMKLNLGYQLFIEKCKECKTHELVNGKKHIVLSSEDAIAALARENWKPVISSDVI